MQTFLLLGSSPTHPRSVWLLYDTALEIVELAENGDRGLHIPICFATNGTASHVSMPVTITSISITSQPVGSPDLYYFDFGVKILKLGTSSLSLALGNLVVARQILLIFNFSYLRCSVQFDNKNYCHAKIDLFRACWGHYFVREWCIVSLEEVLMNTPSCRKPSVVLTSKVRWARLENSCTRKTAGNFYKKNVHIWSYYFQKEEFP